MVDVLVFFNDTATTEIYTLSLHDALPIWRAWAPPYPRRRHGRRHPLRRPRPRAVRHPGLGDGRGAHAGVHERGGARPHADRKSTRLNSSHANISYAVFCLKKNSSIFYLTL